MGVPRKLKRLGVIAVAAALASFAGAAASAPSAHAASSCYYGVVQVYPCSTGYVTPFMIVQKDNMAAWRYRSHYQGLNSYWRVGVKRTSSQTWEAHWGTGWFMRNPYPANNSAPFTEELNGAQGTGLQSWYCYDTQSSTVCN